MTIQCPQCSEAIPTEADQRPRPWCPRCGADLKPGKPVVQAAAAVAGRENGALLVGTDVDFRPAGDPRPAATKPQPREASRTGAEHAPGGPECPGCGVALLIPDWTDGLVVFCPECGQCLGAPPPLAPAVVEGLWLDRHWTGAKTKVKLPGYYGIGLGALLIAVLAIPGIDPFLGLAVALFGGALFVEGTSRLRAEARKRGPGQAVETLELPEDMPEGAEALGGLTAVFVTKNRWEEALALALVALAIGCGEVFLLDWMHQGILSPKLILAAIMAPPMALYVLYRAVRILWERRQVLIFEYGLVSIEGRQIDAYPLERIETITHKDIGDAIDEEAVEIRLKFGKPPLCFTCCHFQHLDRFYARIMRVRSSLPPPPDDD